MSTSTPSHSSPAALAVPLDPDQAALPQRRREQLTMGLQAFGCAAVGAAGWALGGPGGAVAAALLCAAIRLFAKDAHGQPRVPANDAQRKALHLPGTVVPVWQRNVDAAREHAQNSANQLLESFAAIIDHLDSATQGTAKSMGAKSADMDELLAQHAPQIETLLATTRRVVRLKDHLVSGVEDLSGTLDDMQRLAREVQTISRATHLLALNASVEATRAANGGDGFAVVAKEVRQLAGEARQAGLKLGEHVQTLQHRLRGLQRQARQDDTDDDELERQADENARAVLRALLGSTGEYLRTTVALQQSSRAVQRDLERILVSLQSQDRLSQMLTAVTDDMQRLSGWIEGDADALAASPTRWLERLEQSYTMEEQRTTHHDGVKVEQTRGVEFF